MFLRKFALAFLLALSLGVVSNTVAAQSPILTRISADEMMALLAEEGFMNVEVAGQQDDTQFLQVTLAGEKWQLIMYNCNNQGCTNLQFHIAYSFENGLDGKVTNKWNKERRFGAAYIDDENDPHLEFDFDLEGGVSKGAIREAIKTWGLLVSSFKVFLSE